MIRIVIGVSVAVLLAGAAPAQAQKKTSNCDYTTCMNSCQKAGGGNRQGGCSGFCDKRIRDSARDGLCK